MYFIQIEALLWKSETSEYGVSYPIFMSLTGNSANIIQLVYLIKLAVFGFVTKPIMYLCPFYFHNL
jgi:hypothetical protein